MCVYAHVCSYIGGFSMNIKDDGYNCKVLEYGNGSAEVRFYSSPIRKRLKSKSLHTDADKRAIENLEEIFGKGTIKLVPTGQVYENAEQREARERLNLKNSVARTKKTIYDLARSCEWEYFITLTFDGSKIDRTNFKQCMAKVRVWLQNQRRDYAPDLKFIMVPELHWDNVSWHCHGLLANVENMQFSDSGKVAVGKKAYDRKGLYKDFPAIYNMSGWSLGWSTAIKIHDNEGHKTEQYITKYITKQSCILAKGCHRYYASKNLSSPNVKTYYVGGKSQQDIFLYHYCEKNGKKVVYSKTTDKYIETTYNMLENKE